MSCPEPIPPLDPLIETWPVGKAIQRIYKMKRAPADFNPGVDDKGNPVKPTRFAPIKDQKGNVVPFLYGGSSRECAIFETIFHEVPIKGPDRFVDLDDFQTHGHGEITPQRDFQLVNLTTVGLGRLKVSKIELIESEARDYLDTAKWAESIHHHFPKVDGLFWVSRLYDPGLAFILWGDRVNGVLTGQALSGELQADDGLSQEVKRLALRAGIVVA